MKNTIKLSDTRFPSLARAVVKRVGRDRLEDIVKYGIDGGFNGFIYYTETVAFFKKHRADIMDMAEEMAADLGEDVFAMIGGFGCLKDSKLGAYEISEALNGRGENADIVRNAMAWFAAEEVARELCPDL